MVDDADGLNNKLAMMEDNNSFAIPFMVWADQATDTEKLTDKAW